MAFYPDVVRGEPFKPSAALSNDVRRLVNTLNGMQSGAQRGSACGYSRITVYNSSGLVIPSGSAVNFADNANLCESIVPIVAFTDVERPWGVIQSKLEGGRSGACVVSGPVFVETSGSGDFVKPDVSDPAVFTRGADGAKILFVNSEGRALIDLGGGGGAYNGYFKVIKSSGLSVEVSAGLVVTEGVPLAVPATTLAVGENGFVVLTIVRSDIISDQPFSAVLSFVSAVPDSTWKDTIVPIAKIKTGAVTQLQHSAVCMNDTAKVCVDDTDDTPDYLDKKIEAYDSSIEIIKADGKLKIKGSKGSLLSIKIDPSLSQILRVLTENGVATITADEAPGLGDKLGILYFEDTGAFSYVGTVEHSTL